MLRSPPWRRRARHREPACSSGCGHRRVARKKRPGSPARPGPVLLHLAGTDLPESICPDLHAPRPDGASNRARPAPTSAPVPRTVGRPGLQGLPLHVVLTATVRCDPSGSGSTTSAADRPIHPEGVQTSCTVVTLPGHGAGRSARTSSAANPGGALDVHPRATSVSTASCIAPSSACFAATTAVPSQTRPRAAGTSAAASNTHGRTDPDRLRLLTARNLAGVAEPANTESAGEAEAEGEAGVEPEVRAMPAD